MSPDPKVETRTVAPKDEQAQAVAEDICRVVQDHAEDNVKRVAAILVRFREEQTQHTTAAHNLRAEEARDRQKAEAALAVAEQELDLALQIIRTLHHGIGLQCPEECGICTFIARPDGAPPQKAKRCRHIIPCSDIGKTCSDRPPAWDGAPKAEPGERHAFVGVGAATWDCMKCGKPASDLVHAPADGSRE